MDVSHLKNLSADERRQVLESESIGMEEGGYSKPLTNEEITAIKSEFSQAAIDRAVIHDEFQLVKESFKTRLKPLDSKIKESLEAIKTRGVWTTGLLYKLPDYENRVMYIVDAEGIIVNTRMMKPEERQFTISHSQSLAI